MMKHFQRYLASAFLVFLNIGLWTSEAPAQDIRIQVVDGVREMVYTSPVPPTTDPFTFELATIFGADQGGDTYFLSQPSPYGLTEDGTLYVIEARQTEVHLFAEDGTHLGKFGEKGEGPGEFPMVLQDLIVDGERLYINDPFAQRVNIFSLSGEYTESIPYASDTVSSPYISLYGSKENRQFLVFRPLRRSEVPDGWFRIVRHNERLEVIDTPVEVSEAIETIRLGNSDVVVPVFRNYLPECALGTDLPAAWSYGHEFRIDFLDPEDLSRWAVTIPHEERPVTRALREDAIRGYASRESEEAARRRLRFADNLPHITTPGLMWDTTGRLWVLEYRDRTIEGSPFRFHVFAKDGMWLFRQDLPKRPRLISGEGFYARGEDAEGNPVVEFYRFAKK